MANSRNGDARPYFEQNTNSRDSKQYVAPEFDRSQLTPVPKEFGWRKSVHRGWFQCATRTIEGVKYNDWPFEIACFITQLGDENPENQVRVCGVDAKGKVKKELFIKGNDFSQAQDELYELADTGLNLMFDPVLWSNGKRQRKTRFGWATIAGASAFYLFPEPVIIWEVGSYAYQALIPMHSPVSPDESCRAVFNGSNGFMDATVRSETEELLFLPGSLIHSKLLPSFTATVIYDAYTAVEIGEPDNCWTQY